MKKIVIVGCCGGGKTTLAYELAKKLSLEVYDLDDHFWHAGWITTPDDRWSEIQHDLVSRDKWIISGTYLSTLNIRIDAADTIIFLDLPLWLCFWRVIKRKVKNYCHLERSLPRRIQDNQKFSVRLIKNDIEFLRYVLMFKKNFNSSITKILARISACKKVIKLSSANEVTEFLKNI
jgi:adenylate kinase family enzyme